MKSLKRNGIKIGAIVIIAMISVWLLQNYSLVELRSVVSRFGSAAPLIYILLFMILPVFLFPVPVLVLCGGILFGIGQGTAYTLAGSVLNSILMYYLGRFLLRDFSEGFMATRIPATIITLLHSHNQRALGSIFFVLRLIPLVSYNLINYVAGTTQIRLPVYLLTTVVGILPGTIVFLNTGDKSLNLRSLDFAVSIGLLVALTVISAGILKLYFKRIANKSSDPLN